jgi:TRAP-type C4-dicarboxylate transport system permease small subunit
MGRLNKAIDVVVFYFTAIALILLVVICFAQVVARYAFSSSFAWAEEVSICIMLWATWTGACYAVKRGGHLNIPILPERLSPKIRLMLQSILSGLSVAFLCVIAFTSRGIIEGLTNATFISLPKVPLRLMYISVPVGCVLMIYYVIRIAITDWKLLHNRTKKAV